VGVGVGVGVGEGVCVCVSVCVCVYLKQQFFGLHWEVFGGLSHSL